MIVAVGLVLAGADTPSDQRGAVPTPAFGHATYLVANGSAAFRPAGLRTPGVQARQAAGKAGCALFLYLSALDAALFRRRLCDHYGPDHHRARPWCGGCDVCPGRSRSIWCDRAHWTGTYLEHGAHWAIGALAIILLLSTNHRFAVPEWVTAGGGGFYRGGNYRSAVQRLTVRSPTKFGS